ncbi:MAG: enoyl-CoA hydratase/isomerase family protein [Steroidobacteraceae bacterium]
MSATSSEVLQVRYEGEIAVMTLNNPKRLNAFNWAMRTAMYERLLEIEANDACRAIVLTGAGGNLCAGGDISEMKHREILEARTRTDLAARIFKLLVNGPKPFICAVEGNAAGAGVSFVAASDYAVAARDAKFACAFIKVGLIPDVGAIWSLPRKVGHRKAMELCAFGESIDAAEALRIQLINAVCDPGRALDAALEAGAKFARMPAVAMALMRSALNTGNDTVDMAVTTEVNYQSVLQNSADFAEAARAFVEKRKPVFTGR